MPRFWVYIGDKVQGPLDVSSLSKLSGFNLLSQVCEEGAQAWRMADEVIEIKSYLLSPPRPNSFAIDIGNTAPKLDLPPVPEVEELTLPEPNTNWQDAKSAPKEGPQLEIIAANDQPKAAAAATGPGAGLRSVCETCGYKNPRDGTLCMKCGENLKTDAAAPPVKIQSAVVVPAAVISAPIETPAAPMPTLAPSATIEISFPKIVALGSIVAIVVAGTFWGVRSWKKKHTNAVNPELTLTTKSTVKKKKTSSKKSKRARLLSAPMVEKAAVASPVAVEAAKEAPIPKRAAPEPKTEEVPYHVIAEATPDQKRTPSRADAAYSAKRRADKTLWTSQEEQALRQTQRHRIYGGQRTNERNAEILMQILRDKEYMTAFESGKRIYLFNDMDWGSSAKEPPVYETRLSFSGGRDPDGTPKKPLQFAFKVDIERGTVDPGGVGQIRSNTLHAFFDESRIPPEDRRPIAKDTEELVLAAQPGASPLALDTVVRQFAKVYTTAALARVADAYNLTNVKKKLAHDTRLGTDASVGDVQSGQIAAKPKEAKTEVMSTSEEKKVSKPLPAMAPGAAVEFRMEKGSGRQRTFFVQATSKASPEKIWEVATGYDNLKQFVPDMLVSEREGQDGNALIVHTVHLTRFMFFVFKVNLHMRVIEQPREHSIQFERIAGEFESFRGSFQVVTDPATKLSRMSFTGTVVPTGRGMSLMMEKMSRRLLVPQMEAIRAKAESL